jgi:predicted nucleotidyltransferase
MALDLGDPRTISAALGEVAAGTPWVELVVLFGSAASGRLRPDSDVDVGFLGRAATPEDEATLLAVFERRVGRDVHLTDLRRASELLRIEVVRTGIAAFERTGGGWTTFAAESMSRWFEIEPLVRMCADAVRRRALESGGANRG